MSQSEFERFTADLHANPALRAEAEKARNAASPQTALAAVAAFAASRGYGFTAGQAQERLKAAAARPLSDAQLEPVVGGAEQPKEPQWNPNEPPPIRATPASSQPGKGYQAVDH